MGLKRNTSSSCWITCFYNTALGPDAGKVHGAVGGMPLQDLVDAWNKPFLSMHEGGCPALTRPTKGVVQAPALPYFARFP